MVKYIFLILLFASNLLADNTRSLYHEFLKPGAESRGYAYALTASDLGFISIFYNPANIVSSRNNVNIYFSKENFDYIEDISHLTVGVSFRMLEEPLVYSALSWRQFDLFDLVAYDDNENIVMYTVGTRIKFIDVGINAKYFISKLNSPDLKTDSSGFGFDAGISMTWESLLVSFSAQNIMARIDYSDDYQDRLDIILNAGLRYRLFMDLALYFDAQKLGQDNMINAALAYDLSQTLQFSLGANSRQQIGAGIYFTISSFSIKYGFLYSSDESFQNNSLSFCFGF
ncbi:MAG: hypothetical protein JW827_04175 [Spirochaetes bacterium]|nr:hypothetical protein [Spirochaetota bacterium]